jgi:hypothetical protein
MLMLEAYHGSKLLHTKAASFFRRATHHTALLFIKELFSSPGARCEDDTTPHDKTKENISQIYAFCAT